MDDVDYLTRLISDVTYPHGIQRVTPERLWRLPRVAFFPGGTGVVVGEDLASALPGLTLPRRGAMVLGHNFYNVASYDRLVERPRDISRNATWKNLSKFLQSCGIRLSDCFFSNAFLGLMETNRAMGSHPGHGNPDFRKACRDVLLKSIERQQPRLIIALGLCVTRFLGETIPGLERWKNAETYREFDKRLSDAGFHLRWPTADAPLAAVVIVHPSMRGSNLRHRSFNNLTGDEAEVAMVRRAMNAGEWTTT
jgi:hypothetical protein